MLALLPSSQFRADGGHLPPLRGQSGNKEGLNLMPRCAAHSLEDPCFYCQRGIQPFSNTMDRLNALEGRVRALEKGDKSLEHLDIRKSIGVIRDYALGDLVMLSPGLKALKEKNPFRPLVLVTNPSLFEVLDGAEYLDAILPFHTYGKADFYRTYNLSGFAEVEGPGKLPVSAYRAKSRPNIFANLLGVKSNPTEFPIPVDQEALRKMRVLLSGGKSPLIGLAATCHSAVRTMPPEYVEPLMKMLLKTYKGTIILMGKTENWNDQLANIEMPNVINLINDISIKEMIAVCSLVNAMISPDSGTMHVAGALKVKCLAVMGNNKPKHFSDFYSSVKVLQPSTEELPCVPCEDISHSCLPLPPGIFGAPCMRAMTPERICKAFTEFYHG